MHTLHHPPSLHASRTAALLRTLGVGLVLMAGLCEVAAQESQLLNSYQDGAVLATRTDEPASPTSYEITAVRSRMLAPVGPLAHLDGRMTNEVAGLSYRVWMSRGRADVGVGVGTLGYVMPTADGRVDGPRALAGSVPAVMVGVRYRMSNEHSVFADASGVRGLGADPNGAYYNTKVGMEWKPAKSKLGLEHGALGLHFDSGYKLSLKARRGGLGLYMRSQF
jgi:hypothetical protein